ncbi:MAG: Uma2 family endonuclease, partial [Pseudanabaena sp. CAN_BIN31]|nr:Uma2 family endonuclease [Pseudanabaena sp. CAN_BIN31]
LEFAGFDLVDNKYQAIPPTDAGLLWSDQLELYLGVHEQQLRWFTADGQLIPLPEEQESLAKEQALQRAAKLEAILRSQGIDPDQI